MSPNLDDYLALIPPPNSIKSKYMQWVEANLQPDVNIQTTLASFNTEFHIDTAVGDQLDILGDLVGQPRQVNFEPGGGLTAIMPDDIYRIAIKARILRNNWDGTKEQVYDFWQIWLPDYPVLIMDNQDMSMSVLVLGMPNDIAGAFVFGYDQEGVAGDNDTFIYGYDEGYWEPLESLLRGLVTHDYFTPKPAGVSVDYAFSDDVIFAYDMDTDLMQGYDTGNWILFA